MSDKHIDTVSIFYSEAYGRLTIIGKLYRTFLLNNPILKCSKSFAHWHSLEPHWEHNPQICLLHWHMPLAMGLFHYIIRA